MKNLNIASDKHRNFDCKIVDAYRETNFEKSNLYNELTNNFVAIFSNYRETFVNKIRVENAVEQIIMFKIHELISSFTISFRFFCIFAIKQKTFDMFINIVTFLLFLKNAHFLSAIANDSNFFEQFFLCFFCTKQHHDIFFAHCMSIDLTGKKFKCRVIVINIEKNKKHDDKQMNNAKIWDQECAKRAKMKNEKKNLRN